MSSSDSKEKKEETSLDAYFQQIKQASTSAAAPARPQQQQQEEDEESAQRYFMSEPSMTSEAETTESVHRNRILSLLTPAHDVGAPQDLSPGTTSLSSRDSSMLGGAKVQVQFTPEHALRKRVQLPFIPDTRDLRLPELKHGQKKEAVDSKSNGDSGVKEEGSGSPLALPLSSSSASSDFLRQLKEQAADEAGSGAEGSVVARELTSDTDTDRVENSVASVPHTADAEETLVMTLSDSDEEKDDDDDDDDMRTKDTEGTPLDWEQQHSADDEQAPASTRPRRKRGDKPTHVHRRTRSGDAAAASLMTGGQDWMGMQRDHLPMPPAHTEGEEDDDTIEKPVRHPIHHKTSSSEAAPFDERPLSSEQRNDVMGAANVESSRVDQLGRTGEMHRNPPEGLHHFGEAAREMTPENFSLFAMDPQPAAAWQQSPYGYSLSTIDYNRQPQDYRRGMFVPPGFGRGHGRFPSEDSSMTRESNFSWLSASERLPVAPNFEAMGPSTKHQDGSPSGSSKYDDDSGSYYSDTEEENRDVMSNRMGPVPHSLQELPEAEQLLESREFSGQAHRVMRHSIKVSPLADLRKPGPKTPLSSFRVTDELDTGSYPTFVCPRCNTVQRQYFTVATVPSQLHSPAGYLAVYFGIYVIAALYIFGLEEGWAPLDCVYFAVITLTTAGLGDFVPTSDGAKIICSIFIYFGVACIGLLLGTYLAGMMDDKSAEEAKRKRVENCTNCARIEDIRRQRRREAMMNSSSREFSGHNSHDVSGRSRDAMMSSFGAKRWISERNMDTQASSHDSSPGRSHPMDIHSSPRDSGPDSERSHSERVHTRQLSSSLGSVSEDGNFCTPKDPENKKSADQRGVIGGLGSRTQQEMSPGSAAVLGPQMTRKILRRQSRTRHMSIGHGQQSVFFGTQSASHRRKTSEDLPSQPVIPEGKPLEETSEPAISAGTDDWREDDTEDQREMMDDDEASVYSSSASSLAEEVNALRAPDKVKTAKFIFLTLKQALMNSILIIVIGGVGFHTIEKLTFVDSFYFTTVLLTTVGYGDIHPVTSVGKLFATVYVLVAGTILLHNMSLISMIPLELRKRRLERYVLTQFGDQLDDMALRELATGPLVRRLQLHNTPSATGLDECTREMFALAMLVRLGKVTERDIRETFAAFRRLDVDNDGILSSKSIIAGMMAAKRRETMSQRNEGSSQQFVSPPPPPQYAQQGRQEDYWYHQTGLGAVPFSVDRSEEEFPPARNERRSFSLSPKFRPNSSERSALYPNDRHGYDSVRQDEEQRSYEHARYYDSRLSRSYA